MHLPPPKYSMNHNKKHVDYLKIIFYTIAFCVSIFLYVTLILYIYDIHDIIDNINPYHMFLLYLVTALILIGIFIYYQPKLQNTFFGCYLSFGVFVLSPSAFAGFSLPIIVKECITDNECLSVIQFRTSAFCFIVCSIVWSIVYCKKTWTKQDLSYVQILLQGCLAIFTIVGLFFDVISSHFFKGYKVWYIFILALYLLGPILIQYFVTKCKL